MQHVYAAPGLLEFEAGGRPLRLTAFNGKAPGALMVDFSVKVVPRS